MPIVDVTMVVARDEPIAADLAQALANSVGRALESPPAHTWVRLHVLPQDRYAENNASPDAADLPVFVVVLSRQLPEHSQLMGTIVALTQAISDATGRAVDRVHIEYAPSARGRVSFGGKLVE
jgi:phenylpyruvate tautomerase PptA (4-oxalocrotonate tautomerase family)